MKQLSFLLLLFLSIGLGITSCTSDEQAIDQLEAAPKLDPATIDELYEKYSEEMREGFAIGLSTILSEGTRSDWPSDPRGFAEYFTELSYRELLQILYGLKSDYMEYDKLVTKAWSFFMENVSDEDLIVLNEFVQTYPFSDNKKNVLYKTAGNYPVNSHMGNALVATAARIDNVQSPITDVILEHERVIVVGAEYMKDCEHALVRDLAELCLEDVLVEMEGGGPEDPYADVTVSIGDIYGGIKAYLDYIDCKDKIK